MWSRVLKGVPSPEAWSRFLKISSTRSHQGSFFRNRQTITIAYCLDLDTFPCSSCFHSISKKANLQIRLPNAIWLGRIDLTSISQLLVRYKTE